MFQRLAQGSWLGLTMAIVGACGFDSGGSSAKNDDPPPSTSLPDAGSASGTNAGDGDGSSGDGDHASGDGDANQGSDACTQQLDAIASAFPSAGTLGDCASSAAGKRIADSMFDLTGLSIDNQGTKMTPCAALRCDEHYAYIASNSLPHYDFVPMTPNALTAIPTVFRVALSPSVSAEQASAKEGSSITACGAAYDQYLFAPSTATSNEPSGLCALGGAPTYMFDQLSGGRSDVQQIPCFSAVAFMISGVRVYGPNEAGTPDPYGNPGYNYPNDLVSDTYSHGAQLDLCGGHTGDAMHYHAAKYACFEQTDAHKPAFSYADATKDFDIGRALNDDCTEPSAIVGWSPDGYPIKGPCICVTRAQDGSCTSVRRARSSWSYTGLNAWGNDANEAAVLGNEGKACSKDSDCCSGNDCHMSCSYTVVEDAGAQGGTLAEKRCALTDYAWCTHRYAEPSELVPEGVNFAYLDRCNGYEGPDGYAYHATFSFPYLLGCFHGNAGTTGDWFHETRTGGGNMGMPGGNNTMGPPNCAAGQSSMCCGDKFCGGPETHDNCPADCN
jgi:hypothetical protein